MCNLLKFAVAEDDKDPQCYNDLVEKCEKSLKMQNDYDKKLLSSVSKTSLSSQPIQNDEVKRNFYEKEQTSRLRPRENSNSDTISKDLSQNITIAIPNHTVPNSIEQNEIGRSSNEGVFFATPVNVTDENEVFNNDRNDENSTR